MPALGDITVIATAYGTSASTSAGVESRLEESTAETDPADTGFIADPTDSDDDDNDKMEKRKKH